MDREHADAELPTLHAARVLAACAALVLLGSLAQLVIIVGKQALLGLTTMLLFGGIAAGYRFAMRGVRRPEDRTSELTTR